MHVELVLLALPLRDFAREVTVGRIIDRGARFGVGIEVLAGVAHSQIIGERVA